ncbi:MAG TPA: hypothetical protein VI216_03445 [Candidatus Acidoferrales bacterium]
METQTESVSLLLTAGDISCSVDSCSAIVSAEVDSRLFCVNHFLSVSFQELQARHKRLLQKPDAVAAAAFKEFLSAWARQAEDLEDDARAEDQETKARLREVLGWISSTGKSLRRSPRTATAVPVWLRREDPRRTWEEDTWTSTVSRHGAGFVCRHPVEKGGMVILTRKDKGARASARVIYSRIDSEGQRQIGVELVDRDDFWD